jgi:ammonia channel protein AmtB
MAKWIHNGKPSALGAISGAVAGLVAITPASGVVQPFSALVLSAVGTLILLLILDKIIGLRVSAQGEAVSPDLSHGEQGYDLIS